MKKPSLLIIEDNSLLSSSLFLQLKNQYHIDRTPTLQAAYALLQDHKYDLLLLDRMLPDGDGLELIPLLNKEFPETKICVMSNLAELSARLQGLAAGADHYLAKPFHPQEIFALLQTLLRRGKLYQQTIMRRSCLELNLQSNILARGSLQVTLTPREAQLLELFLNSHDTYVTREQISHWLWENGLETDNSRIHVYAQRLRRKLKHLHGTIVAHYGTGYELRILE